MRHGYQSLQHWIQFEFWNWNEFLFEFFEFWVLSLVFWVLSLVFWVWVLNEFGPKFLSLSFEWVCSIFSLSFWVWLLIEFVKWLLSFEFIKTQNSWVFPIPGISRPFAHHSSVNFMSRVVSILRPFEQLVIFLGWIPYI